jgi:membrane protein DedA with SNARE-associated domain
MFTLVGSLAAAIIFVLTTVGLTGLFALMVVESFGIPPIPSEVILPFTGFLIATGVFPLVPAIAVALAGALVGSFVAYAVGRWWRDRITGLGIGPLRLEERHLARVDRWFAVHGEVAVGLARMVPVIRSYISYPAGTARMSPVRFGAFTLLGSIPFTLALVYAGILLRAHWAVVEREFEFLDYLLLALVVAGAVYVFVLYVAWSRRDRAEEAATAPVPAPTKETPPPAPPGTS